MGYIILLTVIAILTCACIAMAILLIESRVEIMKGPIHRWREAWSKRREIEAALRREQLAKEKAIKAQSDTVEIIAHAKAMARFDVQKAEERVGEAKALAAKADKRVARMGSYIIAEQSTEHIKAIKAENYHAKEKKILRSIEVAAQNGYHLPADEQQQLTRMLKQAHERAIRIAEEKQRQDEIKEQIREEKKAEQEIQRAIKKAEEERKLKEREAAIKQKALEDAIALLGDTHSEQIEEMKARLAEAQAEAEEARLSSERAMSMAQQTKRGHIYVISNLGSFGEDVYKVGMTRRLEPMDRVRELGDASVPFTFDVHAMISSDNAPSLENALHKRLESHRLNKVNYRKEFFKVDLNTIVNAVKEEHGEIEYVADPEALEYFESIAMSESDTDVESLIAEEAAMAEQDD